MRFLLINLTCCFFVAQIHAQSSVSPLECIAPFYHGVASGDPLQDRVIIWTRVTPVYFTQPVSGTYKVALDRNFTNVVSNGNFVSDITKDFTVKIDVLNLQPNTFYYYEFEYNGAHSAVGRTKTLPIGQVDNFRFAVVSCANLEAGYFNAYAGIKERNDVDAVLMLGDYIYEYETDGYSPNANVDRNWEPAEEIVDLNDYRLRYSSYHMDYALRELHQNFPWICIWDDHETANNSHENGADNHNVGEGDWNIRKQNGKQAFFEWLPIRPKVIDSTQVFRSFEIGSLAKLIMLDTRLEGRDPQLNQTDPNLADTSRTILGLPQLDWFKQELSDTNQQWKLVGNQVMMGKINVFGTPLNTDGWDGYPAERQRLYNHISTNGIENMVVMTGDIHTSWAMNLLNNSTPVGVEFVGPSITSPGVPINVGSILTIENPHLKYVELTKRGFVIVDITPQRVQGDWYFVNSIDQMNAGNSCQKSFYTNSGEETLVATNIPSTGHGAFSEENCDPCSRFAANQNIGSDVVVSIYPNPTKEYITIQIHNNGSSENKWIIQDSEGKTIKTPSSTKTPLAGIELMEIDVSDLKSGIYFIQNTKSKTSVRFVKQ